MIKDIKGYEGKYKITENGDVWSYNLYSHKKPIKMVPWADRNDKYMYVVLSKNGKKKHYSIHRLVAEHFIPNPQNLPEVDHIDNNPKNNKADNLRWVTRRENINKCFIESRDQYRNCHRTILFKGETPIKEFRSEKEACLFASENFGVSFTSLQKYKRQGDYHISQR